MTPNDRLDPELQALIATVGTWPDLPPLAAETIGLHRTASFREEAFANPYEEVADVREHVATDGRTPLRIRSYVPLAEGGSTTSAIVRFHGGGMIMGSPENEDRTSRALANRTQCKVFAPAYRLAPEHPFPAGRNDCRTVIEWVARNASMLGVDSQKIAVFGHSAGALLALGCAIALRDSQIRVARYVLLEPTTGPRLDTPSRREFAVGYYVTTAEIETCWDLYLGTPGDLSPLAAPAYASSSDLRIRDPVSIVTSELDPLRDEGEELAGRLRAAGVEVDQQRLEGSIHGSIGYMGVSRLAREAFDTILEILDRAGIGAPAAG